MNAEQLSFDFSAPRQVASTANVHARGYWRAGMVTSLPCFCTVEGLGPRYTQMLPGVVESITGGLASVRIYAAPEYGYTLENYPLHGKLGISVPVGQLGRYHGNIQLQRLVDEGGLATGCEQLAAEVRARVAQASAHESDIARAA